MNRTELITRLKLVQADLNWIVRTVRENEDKIKDLIQWLDQFE